MAAVGAGGDVAESESVGDGVGASDILVDVVVDGEADGLGVGDLTGAAGEEGGCCWCGVSEEGRTYESGCDSDVLHAGGLFVVSV